MDLNTDRDAAIPGRSGQLFIVDIAPEADAAGVFAALRRVGRPWRPAEDLPRLVYVEAGSAEAIEAVPGVASCTRSRTGTLSRSLYAAAALDEAGPAPSWALAGERAEAGAAGVAPQDGVALLRRAGVRHRRRVAGTPPPDRAAALLAAGA